MSANKHPAAWARFMDTQADRGELPTTAKALDMRRGETVTVMMEEKNVSIRSIAAKFEIDASNLAKVLSGLRSFKDQLIRIYAYLMELAEVHN